MDLKRFKDMTLSLFFTKRCRFCRTVTDIRKEICEKCENELFKIDGDICFKCGREKTRCTCKRKPGYYMSVCAPYYYMGAAKKAVTLLKFHNDKDMADILAKDMAQTLKARYDEIDFDFCTFVPAHKNELKRRGYNQAELLCKKLSEETGIPFIDCLDKPFETAPQHSLNEAKRSGNLLGAITLKDNMLQNIEDKRILLCDDIKTTGATLDECAKTLLISGVAEVRCITVCITMNK